MSLSLDEYKQVVAEEGYSMEAFVKPKHIKLTPFPQDSQGVQDPTQWQVWTVGFELFLKEHGLELYMKAAKEEEFVSWHQRSDHSQAGKNYVQVHAMLASVIFASLTSEDKKTFSEVAKQGAKELLAEMNADASLQGHGITQGQIVELRRHYDQTLEDNQGDVNKFRSTVQRELKARGIGITSFEMASSLASSLEGHQYAKYYDVWKKAAKANSGTTEAELKEWEKELKELYALHFRLEARNELPSFAHQSSFEIKQSTYKQQQQQRNSFRSARRSQLQKTAF